MHNAVMVEPFPSKAQQNLVSKNAYCLGYFSDLAKDPHAMTIFCNLTMTILS